MKNNIVLIGMPGAGKSTIGVVLAKKLGMAFVDSDLVIQEKEGKLLHQLIEEQGDSGFREIENRINAGLSYANTIIATGGSVIYGSEAMNHLKEIGTVIYLQLSYNAIEERLGDLEERGVTMAPGQTLQDLYEERCPLYEKYADMVIHCDGYEIRELVVRIGQKMEELSHE